jgi:hypothetical protein
MQPGTDQRDAAELEVLIAINQIIWATKATTRQMPPTLMPGRGS